MERVSRRMKRFWGGRVMKDEPLLSPRRIWRAIHKWFWYVCCENVDVIPLWSLIKYDRRPNASWRAGVY